MIGDRISHYKILERLGSGGMGVVYRALDENLGRDVAVKVLHREVMHDSDRLSRFEREAKAIARLAHPNILSIFDFGHEGGVAFAVTEILEGETLRQRLSRERLHWRKAVSIAASIAEGLAAAHAKGITHRDIKPENIFLTADGRVKILDFGLARLSLPVVTDPMAPTASIPGMGGGVVMGTINYMSPEQLRGEKADTRSDIFTLGCVLYEMLAAMHPFSRGAFALTVTAILMDPAPEVNLSDLEVTIELNRIVGRCLEKNPGERFQSATDLSFALRSVLAEKHRVPGVTAPAQTSPAALQSMQEASRALAAPPRKTAKAKRLLPIVLASALLLCAIGIAVWSKMANRGEIAIAVLPFENPAAKESSLGDQLVERLNQSISELDIIEVKPLQNREFLDGMHNDYQGIARRLGAAALLRVRGRQEKDELEISIELIDGRTGNLMSTPYHFADSTSRVMEDVAEIARSVVEKLRPHLGPMELSRLECLMFYGKGRDELARRTRDSLHAAIGHFQEALSKNPNYARAYVGLAESYCMLGIYGVDDPQKVFPMGRKAAENALRIDYTLAEAHTFLAFVKERYEFNRQAAGDEYKLAIRLRSPRPDGRATTHHRYGIYLLGMRQFLDSIENIQLAKAANPFSQIIMADLAQPYLFSGDLREAIRICNETIDRFPDCGPAYRYRGLAYEQQGDYMKAVADLEAAVKHSGDSLLMKGELGHVYASAGMKEKARSILNELLQQREAGYSSCYRIAQIHACLGEKDAALQRLDQAVKDKDPSLWFLEVDPILKNKLKDEPRFQQLNDSLAQR
ncbi:MAG: serine/threonine protein kinase with repeat [Acidobacteria bacterium]|nr:serine/threonine protein kinase with repeat [Acidobacteriota bacterium]